MKYSYNMNDTNLFKTLTLILEANGVEGEIATAKGKLYRPCGLCVVVKFDQSRKDCDACGPPGWQCYRDYNPKKQRKPWLV